MTVSVEGKGWLLTTDQALWIPPGKVHDIETTNAIFYRSLYVDGLVCNGLSAKPKAVSLTPLFRELVNAASEFSAHYRPESAESRLAAVILDQLQGLDVSPLSLPYPQDRRLLRVIAGFVHKPSEQQTREQWAKVVGASERTLGRLFVKETGLSFTQWRQRYLVSQALQMLREGDSVTSVAEQLGYDSVSAFSSMFKRLVSLTPSQYLRLNSPF